MAINPLLFPAGMANLMGATAAPATPAAPTAPVAPAVSPQQAYMENMRRIAQGDLKSVLSGGDRLMALSALLGSVARGSRTTPQEAMAQVQQTAANKVNTQMQLAQLEMKAEQEKRQKAFVQQYASAVPEAKRGVLENADPAEAFKLVQEEVFRPKQVFQTKRDPETGKMRILFGDGTDTLTDIKLPANTEDRDIGGAIQVIDKDTGNVLQTIPKTMAPGEAARLNLSERQFAFERSKPRGGDGGSGSERGQLVTTDSGYAVWSPKSQTLRPLNTTLKPKAAANPFASILNPTGAPRFGQ